MNLLLLAIILGVIVGVLSFFIPSAWPLTLVAFILLAINGAILLAFILSTINGAINEKNKNKDE